MKYIISPLHYFFLIIGLIVLNVLTTKEKLFTLEITFVNKFIHLHCIFIIYMSVGNLFDFFLVWPPHNSRQILLVCLFLKKRDFFCLYPLLFSTVYITVCYYTSPYSHPLIY